MNLVLLLILIAEICLGLCAWVTPEALRSMAARLLTRADVIEAARKEHARRLEFWQSELGLDQRGSIEEEPMERVAAFQTVQSMARR